jgi:hypothetical protein
MSVCVVGVARKIIITIAIISIGIININTSINTSIISIIIVYVYIGYNIGDTRILIPNISITAINIMYNSVTLVQI